MASQPANPSPSKIPRWKTPPSSPLTRTASFLHGTPQSSPASRLQSSKPKSALSSPRQPISFRASSNYARPTVDMNSGSPSSKSKSDGETRQEGSSRTGTETHSTSAFPPKQGFAEHIGQGEREGATIPEHESSGKSASTVGATNLEHGPSALKAPSHEVTKDNCIGSKSIDVSVLYEANAVQMESTTSIPPPCHRKSPSYLGIYRQRKEYEEQSLHGTDSMCSFGEKQSAMPKDGNETGSSTPVSTSQDEGLSRNVSLEWDLTSHHCKELCTQTTPSMSGAGDRAEQKSAENPIENMFKELFTQTTSSLQDVAHKISKDDLFTQTTPSLIEAKENVSVEDLFTQTTASLVNAVDRASSCIPLGSISKESLLENQTNPSLVVDQTTVQEESEDEDAENVLFSKMKVGTQDAPTKGEEQLEMDYIEALCDRATCIDNDDGEEVEVEIIQCSDPEIPVTITEPFSLEYQNGSLGKPARFTAEGISVQRTKSSPVYQDHNLQGNTAETGQLKFQKHEKAACRASAPSLQEWQTETLIPRLNVSHSGTAIEILPSPVPLNPDELNANWTPHRNLEHEEPGVVLSPKSSLILVQGDKRGRSLKTSFEIINSTSFLQGYKIMVNTVAQSHLQINPSLGLISPHGRAIIKITTDATKNCHANMNDFRIFVKSFRAYCDDPTQLREYYQTLEEQHPELIQSMAIDKVIHWNHDDLAEMLEMMDTIPDEQERETLKVNLHRRISCTMAHEAKLSKMQQLQNINLGWIVANENLRNLLNEMCVLRNNVLFVAFTFLTVFLICLLMPAMMMVTPSEPPPELEAENYIQRVLSSIKENFEYIKEYFTKKLQ